MPPAGRWRIDDGEEARLTPEGPTAARIASRGPLAFLRARAPGRPPLRPTFPGTCVALGEADFEVVEERREDGAWLYLLEPWPEDHVRRDRLAYGAGLVRRVQLARADEARARRARAWAPLLLPLLGTLPGELQRTQAERLGLDPRAATLLSAAVEASLGLLLAFGAQLVGLGALLVLPGGRRLVGAAIAGDVSGQWLLELALRLGALGRRGLDEGRPGRPALSRPEFWRRLARPDAVEVQDDGAWLVTGLLPHLSWDGTHAVESGGRHWRVEPLGVRHERSRPVYRYALTAWDAGGTAPAGPAPGAYAAEVRQETAREWDGVLRAFAPFVSLMPVEVQERAFGPRGGPAAARRAVFLSAGVVVALGLYVLSFLPGPPGDPVGPLLALLSVASLGEGLWRLKRIHDGAYAPSLWGRLLPPTWFRPERVAWERHRAAERAALEALGG